MLDQPAKSPLKSLGAIGGAGALVVAGLNIAGVHVAPEFGSNVDAVITGVFAALALYGRLRATTRLTTAPPNDPG